MRVWRIAFAALALLLGYQSQARAFDIVQFTTNLVWCWQHDHDLIGKGDQKLANCKDNWPELCKYRDGIPHHVFLDYVLALYRTLPNPAGAEDLRELYRMCQHHNTRALQYVDVPAVDLARAVRHVAACYPPSRGAAPHPPGAEAAQSGRSIGVTRCPAL